MRVDHNRNSVKVIQKNSSKQTDVLTTPNKKIIALKLKEGTVISKKLEPTISLAKSITSFEILTTSIDTPRPYEIKKLPIVEQQNNYVAPNEVSKSPVKMIIGIILLILGVLGLYYSLSALTVDSLWVGAGIPNGCTEIIRLLAQALICAIIGIGGLFLTIIGLISH